MNTDTAHIVSMYILPAAWIGMSIMSATITLPVLHLRRRILTAAQNADPNDPKAQLGTSIASDDLRGAQMRFMVQIIFIALGVFALGIFPLLISRIAVTVLFFAANALMGSKSVLDFRGLSRQLDMAARRQSSHEQGRKT